MAIFSGFNFGGYFNLLAAFLDGDYFFDFHCRLFNITSVATQVTGILGFCKILYLTTKHTSLKNGYSIPLNKPSSNVSQIY